MTKSERTRQFIVEKTAPVFNKYGFDGASLAVLEEATGLTKGSLYGNFSGKEDIAREAFRYSMKRVREVGQSLIARNASSKGKLLRLLSFFSDYVFNPPIDGGCPLLNTAVQADDHHTFFRDVVTEEIGKTITYIAMLIDEGKQRGEFVKNARSKELATVFFSLIEGALMISRVSSSDVAMKHAVKHCKSILDTITIK